MNFYNKTIRFLDQNGKPYSEWGCKPLKELIAVGKAGGTPTASNKSYYVGEDASIPFLGISDMTEQGKYLGNTSKNITKEGLDSSAAWIVPVGYLVYAMYASVGKVGIVKKPMATSQAMFSMAFKESTDTEYVYYYLEHFRDNGLNTLITTGTQGNINAEILKSIQIPLPSLPEQHKIAEFFSALDERIVLTADKVKLLKEQKAGYLQKVFNRELVFTDYNGDTYGDWEQKKLGEILDLCQNGTNATQNLHEKGCPVTRIETISSGKINMSKVGYVETDTSLEKHLLKPDDILFSNINSIEHIGKTAIVTDDLSTLYHGMNLLLLRTNPGTSGQYLFHYLSTDNARKHFRKIANKAVSQASINQTEVAKTIIPTPSLPEQKKIAEFFSALDEQIELTENKLALLKEQKKGYLQGIFG